MKRLLGYAILAIFLFSAIGAFAADIDQPTVPPTETTKDRASRAMNNILYGPTETPANIDETKTKGSQMDRCSTKTRSGVERGIARVVSGVWQLATFWYSDPGCVTSTTGGKANPPAAPAPETK